MRFKNISLRWRLLFICLFLVIIPTVTLGILTYDTFERNAYLETEQKLKIITDSWKLLANSYVQQEERILKREEFLVKQRLSTITLDVQKILELDYKHYKGTSSGLVNPAFDVISGIKIGRNGYVFVVDTTGKILLHPDKNLEGKSIFLLVNSSQEKSLEVALAQAKLLGKGQTYSFSYIETYNKEIPKEVLSSLSYFSEAGLIVFTNAQYIDFRSNELENNLKDEFRSLAVKQRIGENGYIWIINSDGEYVLSKNNMRDGEKILEFTDENGNKIIRDIIEHTKENHDSVYINHYGWKNIGEDALLMRVSACSYLSQRDWIICSSTYHSDFLNGLEKIKKNIIIVGLVAVVFGSAIAYFFALFISRPINALEKNSTIAASGNLNIEFGRELLQSSGEVGSLARSFNIMLVNLRNKIAETEESRRALIMSNEQLLKAKQDVEGKNIELEKFNKMAVGRELKMVELKARIRDLEGKKVYKDEKL